jgi:hypothetical protein
VVKEEQQEHQTQKRKNNSDGHTDRWDKSRTRLRGIAYCGEHQQRVGKDADESACDTLRDAIGQKAAQRTGAFDDGSREKDALVSIFLPAWALNTLEQSFLLPSQGKAWYNRKRSMHGVPGSLVGRSRCFFVCDFDTLSPQTFQ